MYVNDTAREIDAAPLIPEDRTLLPVRWIAEPLGAELGWDATELKVTALLGPTTVELWVGRNTARVNGRATPSTPATPPWCR